VATSLSSKILQYDGVPKNSPPPQPEGLPSRTTPAGPILQHFSSSAVTRARAIHRLTLCELII